jgi:hypothetical protein
MTKNLSQNAPMARLFGSSGMDSTGGSAYEKSLSVRHDILFDGMHGRADSIF